MDPRATLRDWVTSRAQSPEDAKDASRLIAAFVAEAVRVDRAKRKRPEVYDRFAAMAAALKSLGSP